MTPVGHVLLTAPTNAALNALSKTLVKDYPELERDFTVDIDGEAKRERIPQLSEICRQYNTPNMSIIEEVLPPYR